MNLEEEFEQLGKRLEQDGRLQPDLLKLEEEKLLELAENREDERRREAGRE